MSSHEENFTKLLGFVAAQLARGDHQAATKIEVVYTPGSGYSHEIIRSWHKSQKDDFKYFDDGNQVYVNMLVNEILDRAEGHASSFGQGRHRFTVRVTQFLGGRETCTFVCMPSFEGDGLGMVAADGSGAVLEPTTTGLVGQLMRHIENRDRSIKDMLGSFLSSFRELTSQMREENTELRQQLTQRDAERRQWLSEIEGARSQEHQRTLEASKEISKQERTDYAFKKIMGLLPVALSAWVKGKGGGKNGAKQPPSPLAKLVGDLIESLNPEQRAQVEETLDIEQRIMLSEAITIATEGGEMILLPQLVNDLVSTLRAAQVQAVMAILNKDQAMMFVKAMHLAKSQAESTNPPNGHAGANANSTTDNATP